MVHPILKKTNYSLLLNCTDSGNVQPYDEAG